ncbi:hypothetical protein Tco_0397968 [Tanacetum coccineum]
MQQFWYTIKKIHDTDSYEFLLANKKCIVNAKVFRTILNICPRVEGVDFTDVPDDDTALSSLILVARLASNDKLRKSRIDILWGMFNRENVDYPKLIWEDLAYQIDHKKEKRSRLKEPVLNQGFLMRKKDITEKKVILEWGDEQDNEHSDDDVEKEDKEGDADDEGDEHISDDDENESDEEEIYKYKISVRTDKDKEMTNAEVAGSYKGVEEVTDAVKADAEKTSEVKDDPKKTELPPTSSRLSVSSDTNVSSLMDIPIQQETPQTQSPSVQKVPILVIPETTNLPPRPKTLTETPVSTAVSSPQVTPIISTVQQTPTPILTPPITTDAPIITTTISGSNALMDVQLRVAKLEQDV